MKVRRHHYYCYSMIFSYGMVISMSEQLPNGPLHHLQLSMKHVSLMYINIIVLHQQIRYHHCRRRRRHRHRYRLIPLPQTILVLGHIHYILNVYG
jgi:hypothetical protein